MYKNIIFDLGGVMVDFDPKDYLMERFCSTSIEEAVYLLTFGSPEWQQMDAGLLTPAEATGRMLRNAESAGRRFEVQAVMDEWQRILRPRRQMQELVRLLKGRGYCVYYLSNTSEEVLDLLMQRDLDGLFDGGVASFEIHVNKPDAAIYETLLEKYHLKAGESLFIDDRRENLQTAFALGFATILMPESAGSLKRKLATCGITLR